MKFTKQNIKDLNIRKSRYIVMDDSTPNFGIKVYPSGKKAFIIKVKSGSKTKEYTISDCSVDSAAEARKKSAEVIKKYHKGIDVKAQEKQEQVQNKTLESCVEDYLKRKNPKASTQADIKKYKAAWTKWLKKPIKDITQAMVLRSYDKRVKESFHAARLEAAYLRTIWNFFKKELKLGESPTVILNEDRKGWSKKTTKKRRLNVETASEWFAALDNINERDRSMFLVAYYSGMRAGEIMGLTWKSLSFKNRSLHLDDTKNGEPLDIPLNSQTIKVLEAIKESEFKHMVFVFPAVDRKGNVSAMKYYSKSLTKLKAVGVMWSVHDARRGFISAGGLTGSNSYMVRQLVNHAGEESTHDGYHDYDIVDLRPTSQKIGDYLENQLTTDNVVQLHPEKEVG